MSYKSLLLYAEPSERSKARIQAGLGIARKFKASVIGLAAGMVRPMMDPYGGMVAGMAFEAEQRQLGDGFKEAEATFRALATEARVDHEFRTAFNFPAQAIIESAAIADLIIVAPQKSRLLHDPYAEVVPGDVVMGSGRPVLVVPPAVSAVDARNILVAWKDTREARRALSDALPFLRAAMAVLVIEIVEHEKNATADFSDVQAFLGRHEVDATVRHVAARGGVSAEDHLLDLAAEEGADLIVAGGYGHARVREWAFGGVTRALLTDSPLPVLLSH